MIVETIAPFISTQYYKGGYMLFEECLDFDLVHVNSISSYKFWLAFVIELTQTIYV